MSWYLLHEQTIVFCGFVFNTSFYIYGSDMTTRLSKEGSNYNGRFQYPGDEARSQTAIPTLYQVNRGSYKPGEVPITIYSAQSKLSILFESRQRVQTPAEIIGRNPDHDLDHTQHLLDWSLARDTPVVKNSCQSVRSGSDLNSNLDPDQNPDHSPNLTDCSEADLW